MPASHRERLGVCALWSNPWVLLPLVSHDDPYGASQIPLRVLFSVSLFVLLPLFVPLQVSLVLSSAPLPLLFPFPFLSCPLPPRSSFLVPSWFLRLPLWFLALVLICHSLGPLAGSPPVSQPLLRPVVSQVVVVLFLILFSPFSLSLSLPFLAPLPVSLPVPSSFVRVSTPFSLSFSVSLSFSRTENLSSNPPPDGALPQPHHRPSRSSPPSDSTSLRDNTAAYRSRVEGGPPALV